jgi:hypothetical protein
MTAAECVKNLEEFYASEQFKKMIQADKQRREQAYANIKHMILKACEKRGLSTSKKYFSKSIL